MKESTTPPAVQAQHDAAVAEAEAMEAQAANMTSPPIQQGYQPPDQVEAAPIAKSLADIVQPDDQPVQTQRPTMADAVAQPASDAQLQQQVAMITRERDQARHQLATLQGKYDTEVPQLHQARRELEDKIAGQSDEISRLREEFAAFSEQRQSAATEDGWKSLLNEEERAEYVSPEEAYGVAGRAVLGEIEAREARRRRETDRKLAKIEADLQRRAAAEAEQSFWSRMDSIHPGSSKINQLPEFKAFLDTEMDPISGLKMREVANAAARAGDLGRVVEVIQQYEQKNGLSESLDPELAGQVKPGGLPMSGSRAIQKGMKPMITQSMVDQHTRDTISGKYGRDYLDNPEYQKMQNAIDLAFEEDRVVAG